MADYRLSAQTISRSKGQSSIASAAYRSGERLVDERTGITHDYTRKQGVTHSEVMTPEATPEWMQDRAQLWNAVEAVERRKDAQLSREIQLSLPHELTDDQRKELVRGFVQEQFVDRGMIADLAIHAPSAQGDDRNHHAHVMLTMRTMTGEGFGNKNRDWNSPELLTEWREEWAHHQNRVLEREGHAERVSHLSYEAQGVDREPSQHLGPVASDMERNGKASRIGDENRQIANDNRATVIEMAEAAKATTLDKVAEIDRNEIQATQDLAALDLSQRHDREKSRLEAQLEQTYGQTKATIGAEIAAIDKRLGATGVRKVLRNVFGKTSNDRETRRKMVATVTDIAKRENEARGALEKRQKQERNSQARQQNEKREQYVKDRQEARETGRGAKVRTRTKPAPVKQRSSTRATTMKQTVPPLKPSDAPDLATEKTVITPALDAVKDRAKLPWQRASISNENKRPWTREDEGPKREPKPSGPKPDGGNR